MFEGLWSRQTHPKDFPTNEWLTHFSDIIGASHSADYRVWEYGGIASDGLRQVAEWGSTRQLETELKSEVITHLFYLTIRLALIIFPIIYGNEITVDHRQIAIIIIYRLTGAAKTLVIFHFYISFNIRRFNITFDQNSIFSFHSGSI